jgi:uncharacterized membrane protein
MESWLIIGHLIGVLLWVGGLFSVYWLLRIHEHAREVHEKLLLMERSIALSMDLAATLAIGCGIALAVRLHAFSQGWLHVKLAVVVFGILPVHGIIRARIGKLSRGQQVTVPSWLWSLLLVAITLIVIAVFRGPIWFAKA